MPGLWRSKALRTALVAAGVSALALSVTGCGNTIFVVNANSAANKLEEAEALGAEQYAAYEYWMAHEYLVKARSEAAEADYSDAINLADESEEFAQKAIELSKAAHRGAGR
jgi:hypothetical protein